MEGYSKARTSDAITALAGLRPVEAQLVVAVSPCDSFPAKRADYDAEKTESGTDLPAPLGMRIQKITPDFLEVGDIISCNTGASPPADGTIMVGPQTAFTFDESMLTGESMPVAKRAGDQVFLGSINRGQSVHIKVDKIGGGTM
jgi:P-type E1-E2 ATPase